VMERSVLNGSPGDRMAQKSPGTMLFVHLLDDALPRRLWVPRQLPDVPDGR